jgi:hypothetical protein
VQNSGIQDPEQSKQYTQHGVEVLNEQSNHNPQELQSAIGRFLGGGESGKHTGSGSGGTEHMFDI